MKLSRSEVLAMAVRGAVGIVSVVPTPYGFEPFTTLADEMYPGNSELPDEYPILTGTLVEKLFELLC